MSGHQHTAAPWRADIGRGHAVIRGSDGDTIAVMALHTGDRSGPEQVANAHILGASVEVLLALEGLMVPLNAADADGVSVDPACLTAKLWDARRAIAKARGGRPG